jgi:quercetin dioxygenase-like cupin family protein
MKKIASHAIVAIVVFIGTVVVMRSQQSGTQRFPQFENEDVKVWKSVVYPGAPLTMHRHDHPRVIIALKGGTMKIVEKSGGSEDHAWEIGHAYWLPANPPDTQHADVNAGKDPIEVIVVELEKER